MDDTVLPKMLTRLTRRKADETAGGKRWPARFWSAAVFLSALPIALVAILATWPEANSLEQNGQWIAVKTLMEVPPMGAQEYFHGDPVADERSIREGRLDLGIWYGFQEVLFKQKLVPREVSFRFMLDPNAYLVFLFDRDDTRFAGLRFSNEAAHPSAFLAGLVSGAFLDKRPVPELVPDASTWHDCRVSFLEHQVRYWVDGREFTVEHEATSQAQWLGFKGGYNRVLIGDIQIVDANGSVHVETFNPAGAWQRCFPAIPLVLLILLIEGALLLAFRLCFRSWRRSIENVVALNLCLSAGVVTLVVFLLFIARSPTQPGRAPRVNEVYFRQEARRLMKKYPPPTSAGTRRVMFLGSSQTRGMGARTLEEAFPETVEQDLNRIAGAGQRFECLNFGISGTKTADMVRLYEQYGQGCAPELVVIDLCCNDVGQGTDLNEYAATVGRLVDLCRQSNAKVLLIVEAADPESAPDGFATVPTLRKVAEEKQVPLVDAAAYLNARLDDGFLFWDLVHPTSYGYRLMADCLFPRIAEQLGLQAP